LGGCTKAIDYNHTIAKCFDEHYYQPNYCINRACCASAKGTSSSGQSSRLWR
jgi:hypothetical protein